MKAYEVQVEVAGPAAMWTRADSGSAAVSHEGPTSSAVKGIFESVARLKTAWIRPTRAEICRPIQFHRYANNYGGPLRKANQIRGGDPYQFRAIILVDVCYRFYGVVEEASAFEGPTNHLHHLQEMFMRRVSRGQSFRPVCLGWSEFVATYVGPLRPETKIQTAINLTIPSMHFTAFDRPISGKFRPKFRQDVQIRNGVLEYAL